MKKKIKDRERKMMEEFIDKYEEEIEKSSPKELAEIIKKNSNFLANMLKTVIFQSKAKKESVLARINLISLLAKKLEEKICLGK